MAMKDFHTELRVTVWHETTGYQFRNQGGRIRVEDQAGHYVDSIWSSELLKYTNANKAIPARLIKQLANRWVKDNT